ncbi:MAG: hypothetical protein KGN78_13885, partial [Actinomycetales bacterium]|nr:hypothetical protein [Actinomycetales bacterium]
DLQSGPKGRGRMIALEDRQAMVRDIGIAHRAGARLSKACEVCGIDRRMIWSPKNGHHKVYYFLTLWRLYEEVNTGSAVHG